MLDSLTSGRAPAWGAAIAEPGERAILLRADQDDLTGTLRHELAHLALHEAVRVRVPLWFDEGYAAWGAGEWERFGGLELNLAVVRGAIPSLTALDGALRGFAATADAAYALAASAVTELARRNPTHTLTPLMQRLEHGDDFETAVPARTKFTVFDKVYPTRRMVFTIVSSHWLLNSRPVEPVWSVTSPELCKSSAMVILPGCFGSVLR